MKYSWILRSPYSAILLVIEAIEDKIRVGQSSGAGSLSASILAQSGFYMETCVMWPKFSELIFEMSRTSSCWCFWTLPHTFQYMLNNFIRMCHRRSPDTRKVSYWPLLLKTGNQSINCWVRFAHKNIDDMHDALKQLTVGFQNKIRCVAHII